MKLTKILTLSTMGLAAVLGLAACGTGGGGGDNATIDIWATAAEEAVIKAVVDNWNEENPNDTIAYRFTAVSEADAGTTVAKDPTVSGAPALFLCADDHIYNLQSKNIILEVTGSYKEDILANRIETSVTGASYNGKLYGWPVTSDNGYFLWYDSRYLTAEDVTSLETILQKAKAAGKTFLMDVANGYYANSFVMSPQACGLTSLSWTTNSQGQVYYNSTWDDATGVAVSEYIAGLLTPAYADGTLVVGGNEIIAAGMGTTMIAAVSGTWMEPELTKTLGANLSASKLPSYHIDGEAYQMASFSGTKVYCINKTRPVEEQKTAAKLARLLTDTEAQLTRFEIRNTLPCDVDAVEDARYTENVSIGSTALLEQNAAAGAIQSACAQDRYWDIGAAIGQAYIDSKLPETANTWASFLKAEMDTLRQPI